MDRLLCLTACLLTLAGQDPPIRHVPATIDSAFAIRTDED
jgi:hypothetical protein